MRYRLQRHDGTDCSATMVPFTVLRMVPIQRYRQKQDTFVLDFANAVRNGDKQVAQITFNDDIISIVASMLEEKTEFVQTYFANPDFQNFVNAKVFQAAVSQLSNR